ncbi:pantoate--beta-alanine ligase [Aeromicrobium sp. Root495]|uniref:pantoate--beta-alanine ligase n=1 Tax=Aeromicrobium sp. Root495 TaxID=1736550 RepID=UPI0007019414|nr:pantoate--beta-alanine ligase [Aeromicrobium sp. Root495]KQY60438.1 pantoate--beta-alanine ligase [Aeromicrobium sp. Root495]
MPAPVVARTRAELDAALRGARHDGSTVALVPTMGALHDGHAALVRQARDLGDVAVVSIFVNPTQFGPGEDLEAYPRTPDADLALCEREDVDVVFMPSVEEMYPGGVESSVMVDPGPLGTILEGAARPTHFRGVLTVVAKLFAVVRPDVAVFGEKDFQQLALIRRMVRDLGLDVRIEGHHIVREDDGLALSSRNTYLSAEEHQQALALSRALQAGAAEGAVGPVAVLKTAWDVLGDAPGVQPDYLVLTDAYLGDVPPDFTGEARLVVAAKVGTTRLLDNLPVSLTPPPEGR